MNLNIDCKLKCENKDKFAEMYINPDVNGGITFNVIVNATQYDFSLSCKELDYFKKFAKITRCHQSACNMDKILKKGGGDE